MEELETIRFSKNRNNKLLCDCFTTIRLGNPLIYNLGETYNIHMGRHYIGRAEIVELERLWLRDITPKMSYTATGEPLSYLYSILDEKYPDTNWSLKKLNCMVFQWSSKGTVHAHMVTERQGTLRIPFRPHAL